MSRYMLMGDLFMKVKGGFIFVKFMVPIETIYWRPYTLHCHGHDAQGKYDKRLAS